MRNTNLYIIINEYDLTALSDNEGNTLKFKTEEEANEYASHRLEMWQIFHAHFNHKFIHHTIN